MDKTAALAHLDEHGYVVLEGALTPDQADALQSRSYELIEAERAAGGQHIYQDGHSQRVWNLLNKGRIFEEMIQLPQVLDFQSYLLGDDCVLSSYTVNMIGAGADAGQLHIDLPLSSFPLPLPTNAFCGNSVFVLDDFTAENGATRVIPGSHKYGYGPEPDKVYDEEIQLQARKGDIVIFHGAIWHASGANRTATARMILLGFFSRSFLKPQQDNLKLVKPEVLERATPTMRRLLGVDSQSGLNT